MEIWWLEQSVAEVPAADDWLSPGEKLRVDTMRFPKRRADWRLGRWTVKRAVAAYLKVACDPGMLARIEIRSALSGAPEVFLDNHLAKVSVSITHRAGIAVCAVAPSEMTIGCDLELIEPRGEAFLADYFTAGEQALLKRVSAAEQIGSSTLLWSAKESALKALKVGLRADTCSVEVSLGDATPNCVEDFLKPTASPFLSATPQHLGGWRPLTVTHANHQDLCGWWLSADEFVRTIVTVPSSPPPTILSLSRDNRDRQVGSRYVLDKQSVISGANPSVGEHER
jgi:4'-phosphopantetheinyl transferase